MIVGVVRDGVEMEGSGETSIFDMGSIGAFLTGDTSVYRPFFELNLR